VPTLLPSLGTNVYYYESSLCSTREAGAICRAIREYYQLVPIATRILPGRSSDVETSLPPEVRVSLSRIEDSSRH
jgi:hypothetical protein